MTAALAATQVEEKSESLFEELDAALDRMFAVDSLFLQMVSDYPPGDPANAKMAASMVRHAPITALLPNVDVRPLDTAQLSFRALMLMFSPDECLGANTFHYLNAAPIEKEHHRNGEHPLCIALLTNGMIVASPNAGYSLSAFKPWIKQLFVVECDQAGKQFRSWQSFPPAIGRVLRRDFTGVELVYDIDAFIPDLPEQLIWDHDNFRNLRTLVTQEELAVRGFHSGDECYLERDGIPITKVLYGDPAPGKEARYKGWLGMKAGSNIIIPGEDHAPRTHVDVFRVKGMASRRAVYDVDKYHVGLLDSFREASAVFVRANRTAGLLNGCYGFIKALSLRLGEWRRDIGEYERQLPVYSLRKI